MRRPAAPDPARLASILRNLDGKAVVVAGDFVADEYVYGETERISRTRQAYHPPMLSPVTLTGTHVRLEALSRQHLPGLLEIGLDPSLWALTVSKVRSAGDLERYVTRALEEQARGSALPFATVWRDTGRIIGSTRFGNIALEHQRLEIGWTWLAPAWQRTAANTEAKLLMLSHAFDTLGMRRVEFKTSALNARSRAALLRIGAIEEGTLRQHTVNEDGTIRDTVYFSILSHEWPGVRARLQRKLAIPPPSRLFSPPCPTPPRSP